MTPHCPVHAGIHPLGRHPPGRHPPSRHTHTQADTALGRHLPPGRHPPLVATAADGTHPTGMHSCSEIYLLLGQKILNFLETVLTSVFLSEKYCCSGIISLVSFYHQKYPISITENLTLERCCVLMWIMCLWVEHTLYPVIILSSMTPLLDQKSTLWAFETYGDATWTKETQSLVFNLVFRK